MDADRVGETRHLLLPLDFSTGIQILKEEANIQVT
jgi:hypothetical protein